MSPAGALPFASFAAAVSCQKGDSAVQHAACAVQPEPAALVARAERAGAGEVPLSASVRLIWRSPSGPAPSQAPPAAA